MTREEVIKAEYEKLLNSIPFRKEFIMEHLGDTPYLEAIYQSYDNNFFKLEVQILLPDGDRRYFVFTQTVQKDKVELVEINDYKNIEERDKEIRRLYEEKGLTPIFLANVFRLKTPKNELSQILGISITEFTNIMNNIYINVYYNIQPTTLEN